MNVVGNKWVFRVKYNAKVQSNACSQRVSSKCCSGYKHYSPVVKLATIRVVLSLAVSLCWPIEQLDINNTFLNGTLQETVYMSQPEGFIQSQSSHMICKLHKSLYGLKQAERAWYDKLKASLLIRDL
ncbi:hypothetical protein ACOSQ3_021310 [Xanthoceras sorbifolium]